MLTRKLFRSTIFRLTLLYAVFFCFSIIGILTFVYFATVREMESQIKHRINIQINQAQSAFNAKGLDELKKQISEFLDEEDEGLFIYILTDSNGKTVIGNMENFPEEVKYSENWLMFDIDAKNDEDATHILARDANLAGGYRLLIGYSLKGPDKTKSVMFDVVSASIFLAFFITALGGAMFSGVIRRRLEEINHICTQVIGGNLDVKVPRTGGGDEFDNLAGNINSMLARIAELVGGLKQTSDNIAHDLRTPLNRHRISLENIINHPTSPKKINETLKEGIEEIDNIVETLNSILRISQAQSGVASGHFVEFDLSTVAIDVIEFYEEFSEQKGITITTSIEAELIINGDKPLITQAIANLIDNAIKYTPAGGEVSISIIKQDKSIECIVADNGAGIPEDFYDKVKERFFRMEESRTSAGTGLGLSLVDAVATLHKGMLTFSDNNPGLKAILILAADYL